MNIMIPSTYTDMSNIREVFDIPVQERNFFWERLLFATLPKGYYELLGTTVGPDGRTYVAAKLCDDIQISLISEAQKISHNEIPHKGDMGICNYASLNDYALEHLAGIAFFSDRADLSDPLAVLRLGSIWSYHEYLHLGGCSNCVCHFERALEVNIQNPFTIRISESQNFRVGKPNEAFFPSYVQDLIIQEIKEIIPDSKIEFMLKDEPYLMMPYSIVISLDGSYSTDIVQKIQNMSLWYMPPYLPVDVLTK